MSEPSRSLLLPLRLVNGSNSREHWAKRAKRAKEQRSTTTTVLRSLWEAPGLPVKVRIVRIGPRRLDRDGAITSMKHVIDGVADWLGCDDGDPRIEWDYAQERGKPKEFAVKIEVFK